MTGTKRGRLAALAAVAVAFPKGAQRRPKEAAAGLAAVAVSNKCSILDYAHYNRAA
jgi:hypothetical protein